MEILFWLAMFANSLMIAWYVTLPILIVFFLASLYCIKRFSRVRYTAALALMLTIVFYVSVSMDSNGGAV